MKLWTLDEWRFSVSSGLAGTRITGLGGVAGGCDKGDGEGRANSYGDGSSSDSLKKES